MTEINEYGQTVGATLADWQGAAPLARRPLVGRYCRLEPLNPDAHSDDLFAAYAAVADERDWTWLASVRPQTPMATRLWLLSKAADPALVPFAIIDARSGRAVGIIAFMAIDRPNGQVEIGHVTWSTQMKNSALGSETVWLLLREAFACGYRRVEWRCDSLNLASRRAAERLGFVWEGRLRQRMVRKGRNRDSDILSLLDSEWPQCDAALQAWLAVENFTAEGQQIQRLESFRQ